MNSPHQHREQSPWRADRHKDRLHRRPSARTRDRCSRTRICGRQDRYVLAQEAPDILNINVARGLSRSGPVHREAAPYPEAPECACSGLAVDRLLARPWTILQSTKAVLGKAPAPVADNARLNAHFLGDRPRAATLSRQQHYSRPLHVALRCAWCPAARLKHFAHLRGEPNLSCFGNHPDLES
jgi:hypothetical protein